MKDRVNLSRWALEHIPLVRYLMVVLLLGGILGYSKLGQDEDPPFTFRAMVVRAYWQAQAHCKWLSRSLIN